MIWWLKARAVPQVLATMCATLALAALAHGEAIPVPTIIGPSGSLLFGQILGLLPTVVLLWGIERGDAMAEEVAVRPARPRTLALCLAYVVVLAALATVVHALFDRPDVLSMARNSIGSLGAALILRALVGPGIAAIAIAALPLLCAAAGRRPGGSAQPWAWPIHPAHSALALAEAGFLLLVGCLLLLWRRRPAANLLALGT
ncbi:hypothetical protein C3486_26840 [Streptomyces sp. Ru73]|uniref:hypothetical protein n=1 Tax=Streptomyces sp. Ru73 TaxID=2080748 RepID=UPI000CDE15B8|nr:hypothetical protein [Streptomyces sp. Ru73]POX37711.1 hypothetical protein C3486_26840 [Streptomyces sp. Ru73]